MQIGNKVKRKCKKDTDEYKHKKNAYNKNNMEAYRKETYKKQ